jgi:18S rRNA (adenine1779-N6/adenine1780-N6)-dimethyltransferase
MGCNFYSNLIQFKKGLARLIFSRKNKTLAAVFKNKKLLTILIDNYQTYCSLKNVKIDQEFQKNKEEWIKNKIDTVLEEFSDLRSSKLDNDDLLKLLTSFNENGIHFTSE